MVHLLHARLGETPFTHGCLGGFFHEAVQHHDPLADLSAEKDARDTVGAFRRNSNKPLPNALVCGSPRFGPKTNMRRVRTTYRAARVSGKEAIAVWTASL
jgi:hypothetical protein